MTERTLASVLSAAITARWNCHNSDNGEWQDRWDDVIANAMNELPRGGGFDSYPILDEARTIPDTDKPTVRQLVFSGSYHGMDEHGGYNGWNDYTVFCRPDWTGVSVTVRGGGKHNEYIGDRFHEALNAECSIHPSVQESLT